MRAKRKRTLASRLTELVQQMEKLGLREYMEYLHNIPRMLLMNFLGGVLRGLGVAVGFSLLGAVVIVSLQRLTLENLPLIGDFLAEVVRQVQRKLP